jgi:hypothetical protein
LNFHANHDIEYGTIRRTQENYAVMKFDKEFVSVETLDLSELREVRP